MDEQKGRESKPYRVQRRWVSVAEAKRLLPGRNCSVEAWLRAEGFVRLTPWKTLAVDMDAVYMRLDQVALEAEEVVARDHDAAVPVEHPGMVSAPVGAGADRSTPETGTSRSALRGAPRRTAVRRGKL